MTLAESDRIERERQFHDDRYTDEVRAAAARFYRVGSAGQHAYQAFLDAVPSGCRALEYGCGKGSSAFDLAVRGVDVLGIDISEVAITQARDEAAARGCAPSTTFVQMNAEVLDLDDSSIDLVCGTGILHHLDLERAFAEIARVLAPTGVAVFLEPLGHNPLINLYRRATPEMRTEDEHPLLMADLLGARRWFGRVEADHFELTTLGLAPLAGVPGQARLSTLGAAVDAWLFAHVPGVRRYSWTVLLALREPRPA